MSILVVSIGCDRDTSVGVVDENVARERPLPATTSMPDPVVTEDDSAILLPQTSKDQLRQSAPQATAPVGTTAGPTAVERGSSIPGSPGNQSNEEADFKAALAAALNYQRSARTLAEQGLPDSAYTQALKAWESLQEHADNAACKSLSDQLFDELKNYGQELSDATEKRPDGNVVRKPIRFE